MTLVPYELTDTDYLKSIWAALRRLEGLLAAPATPVPPPTVVLEPPDFSDIVTAVTGLRPSVTAEEIARAIGDTLRFPEPQNANAALEEVAEALKKLEFRLKGIGSQAYGGGAVSLNPGGVVAVNNFPTSLTVTPTYSAVVDSNNSTTSVLAAGATFTGTATDISLYAQINVALFARPSTIQGDGTNAKASLYLEFSPNGTNWDISIPSLIRDPGLSIPTPLINVGKYFRLRYINDGGTAAIASLGLSDTATTPALQTQFRLTAQLLPFSTKELTRTLDQSIDASDAVVLGRSVTMGKNPNGVFTNAPATGAVTSNSTTTNLTAGAGFNGAFVSTLGYSTVDVLINASHDSATSGVVFQFSNDAATVDRSVSYDYVASAGGTFFTLPTEAEYFRLSYTNGGTTTTTLRIETILRVTSPGQVSAPLSSRVPRTLNAILVRNDPIALVTPRSSQESVGVVSAQLTCSSSPLSKRKSLTLKSDANNTNNNIIYISFASPATTGNGFGLSNGDAIDLELGDLDDSGAVIGIYAVATNSSQKLHVIELS